MEGLCTIGMCVVEALGWGRICAHEYTRKAQWVTALWECLDLRNRIAQSAKRIQCTRIRVPVTSWSLGGQRLPDISILRMRPPTQVDGLQQDKARAAAEVGHGGISAPGRDYAHKGKR